MKKLYVLDRACVVETGHALSLLRYILLYLNIILIVSVLVKK